MNERQKRFVAAYRRDPNATQAAIKAGYSEHTAQQQGSRLLSNAVVTAALERTRKDLIAEAQIDAGWLLRRLVELADVDVAEIFTESGAIRDLSAIPLAARRLIAGIDIETRVEGEGENAQRVTTHKLKLSDRIRVLELIGKHLAVGAFKESDVHIGKLVIIRNFTGLEHEQPVLTIDAEATRERLPAGR